MTTETGRGLPRAVTAVLAMCIGASVGCAKSTYYRVNTSLHYGERATQGPELIASGVEVLQGNSRIAIQWPSHCANETSAEAKGDAASDTNITSIDCSVEMSALERRFAQAGYQVVLWDAVRRYALVNKTTPEKAAEQFGISTLIRVNSFERTVALPGSDARWDRTYFKSDKTGAQLASVTASAHEADSLDALAEAAEGELMQAPRIAVTLDVTVEHVPTARVVWFYRWTHVDDVAAKIEGSVIVWCHNQLGCSKQDIAVSGPVQESRARSGSTKAVSVQGRDANAVRARYGELAHALLGDLVARFARAVSGGQPAGDGKALRTYDEPAGGQPAATPVRATPIPGLPPAPPLPGKAP